MSNEEAKMRRCKDSKKTPDETMHICVYASLNFKELLDSRKCFKLICGASNENLDEIEKLIALYAKAGCHFFDLSANEEVLAAAQKGLDFAIPKEKHEDYHFCISVGTKGDTHIQKAKIDVEKCNECGKCVKICPQEAIEANSKQQTANCRVGLLPRQYKITEKNCIGCLKCQKVCKNDAIEIYSKNKPFDLSTFKPFYLSCIELHASDTSEQEVDELWQYLNKNFDGMLSVCLGREKLSNEQILNRVRRLVEQREPYTTIIQADGSPMSGGEDDFRATLQAVAMAEILDNAKLPVYSVLSGGTNTKTAELATQCGVGFHGIAMGSFARKIVKKYIVREDFFKNEIIFSEALEIAKNFVNSLFTIHYSPQCPLDRGSHK